MARDDEDDDDNGDGAEEEPPKKKRSGCLYVWALVGVALLATGIWLLGKWDTFGGPGKAGSVVLVVIGSLMLLPPLLIFGVTLALKYWFNKITRDFKNAAGDIVDNQKALYGQLHTFRDADEDDFDGLDVDWYQRTTRELESDGYRHLGDVVDETIEDANGLTIPVRVLAGADGTVQVALYHFQMPDLPEKFAGSPMHMCDVCTEFSDGTFQLTSNTAAADLTTPPPRIHKKQHSQDTKPRDLIRAHLAERERLLASKPGVHTFAVHTLEEALDSERRQQQAKNDFRKEIGYVDPEEVKRIAEDSGYDPEITARMTQAADEARRREKDGRGGD